MNKFKVSTKLIIWLVFFGTVIGWGIVSPQEVSAYVDNPNVPNSVEANLEANCPASSTAPGQTIGSEWFSPTNISSTNRTGSTTIYATTAMCTNDNYNSVSDILHFIVGANRYQGTGNISFPSGTQFPLMSIPANDWQHASGPVTRPVSFTNLSDGYNCWTIVFDMSAKYGSSTSNITGTGSVDLCVNYILTIPPPTITSSGGCNLNGTGYVRARATGSGNYSYRLVRWDGVSTWIDETLISSQPSGVQVEFDVSSWVSPPSGALHFFYVRVRSDSTGIAYNTPPPPPGYFSIGPCAIQPPPTSLYSIKIDDSQVSAAGSSETTYGFGLAFGGNCYSATAPGGCKNGTLAEYPFSDNCVRIDGGSCHNENPYGSLYDISPGNHTISISPANTNDGPWTLRGYKICKYGAGCTTNYLTKTPLSSGSSFLFNFENGSNYTMRWIYTRTTTPPECAPSTLTLDLGVAGSLMASSGNGSYSWSSPGGTPANGSGNSYSVAYSTEGTYTVTVTSGGEPANCTVRVARKPYFKAFGGDVVAGHGFASGCFNTDADIRAFNRGASGSYGGAGGQLAVFAARTIQEFTSAAGRGSAPAPPNGLSFSNEAGSGTYGGDWNAGDCMPDFFANPEVTPTGGPQSFAGRNLNVGSPAETYYVDGDVFIENNIFYNVGFSTYSITTMPRFKLVVRGNIYVSADVTQLHGIYIAQPDGTSDSGRFYTCAYQPSPLVFRVPDTAELISSTGCGRKLSVFGAVAAQSIRLFRTNGSVLSATPAEIHNNNNQAESFIYTPEVWLGATGGTLDYDAITGLPPIL